MKKLLVVLASFVVALVLSVPALARPDPTETGDSVTVVLPDAAIGNGSAMPPNLQPIDDCNAQLTDAAAATANGDAGDRANVTIAERCPIL